MNWMREDVRGELGIALVGAITKVVAVHGGEVDYFAPPPGRLMSPDEMLEDVGIAVRFNVGSSIHCAVEDALSDALGVGRNSSAAIEED